MCMAAVHGGADAIYVGMPGFNARGRAPTLEIDELRKIIEYCHLYGVKVFLAFNVLIFEDELPEVVAAIEKVAPLAPDAFIVQDIGLVRILREIVPAIPVHASTQMTIASAEAIKMVEPLGMERYVLAREVSISEMKKIREQSTAELEVFVHGALCVAYSGQCLTSERIGGRSANRGQCAQACRLPYKLSVDGVVKDLSGREYLVSPRDLCGLKEVPDLQRLGIESFKIEGRLKSPEYVAATARAYRERVRGELVDSSVESRIAELAVFYSRGFFSGWLEGVNHHRLVDGFNSSHIGSLIGEVTKADREILISGSGDQALEPGHGVVFYDRITKERLGTQVYQARKTKGQLAINVEHEIQRKIRVGMQVYLNSKPAATKELQKLWHDREQLRRVPVDMEIAGSSGERLRITVNDDCGNKVEVVGEVLQKAIKAPTYTAALKAELGALSETPFTLRQFSNKSVGELFIHNKQIKQLRRDLVERLIAMRVDRKAVEVLEPKIIRASPILEQKESSPSLSVLVRQTEQIEALRGLNIDTVYLDFEFGKEYGPALDLVRGLGLRCGIATTRILKTQELGHLAQIKRLKPDLILVRNLGALHVLRDCGIPLVADFSLNISNSVTARWFLTNGIERFCPSYDLNKQQLISLIAVTGGSRAEVTVHQYMPEFHMEHCVFAAFLSKGSSFKDCGRPCEKHSVALIDGEGVVHPLKADAECRNTMYHGVPQASVRLVPDLMEKGVRFFRIEALFEDVTQLRAKVEAYQRLLSGQIGFDQVIREIGVVERYGISEGQLFRIKGYVDRKKNSAGTSSSLNS